MSLGAIVWAIRATVKHGLFAALCTAAAGVSIALFGRINIHGATAIFVPVILAAALATFLLGVIALVQYFKSKIGRTAYFLAVIPFALAGIALFAEFRRESPNEGLPKVAAATKLSELLKSLPQSAHFSLSGLSFFDGKLYVGTNLGIVEVSRGEVTRFY